MQRFDRIVAKVAVPKKIIPEKVSEEEKVDFLPLLVSGFIREL